MKLIDADALLVALRDYWAEGTNETGMEVLDKIIVSLENKGADAEPVKHGKWVMLHKTHNVDESSDYDWRCSECNHVDCHNIKVEVPYCWYCGARMEGEEE